MKTVFFLFSFLLFLHDKCLKFQPKKLLLQIGEQLSLPGLKLESIINDKTANKRQHPKERKDSFVQLLLLSWKTLLEAFVSSAERQKQIITWKPWVYCVIQKCNILYCFSSFSDLSWTRRKPSRRCLGDSDPERVWCSIAALETDSTLTSFQIPKTVLESHQKFRNLKPTRV